MDGAKDETKEKHATSKQNTVLSRLVPSQLSLLSNAAAKYKLQMGSVG